MVTDGKVAVVTGAAAGIGAAVVRRFSDAGWRVLALDRDAAGLSAAWGGTATVTTLPVDITDRAAVIAALGGVPVIDACINVAGVYPDSTFVGFTDEQYRLNFDVNVLGTLLVSQAALPGLRAAAAPVIVNFASIGAYTATGTLTLYKAAKAAVVSLTRSMAVELAPGIRVVGIAPGPVATAQTVDSGSLDTYRNATLLERAADPSELAEWVFALAGDRPLPFITAETIVVSGGAFIR